MKDSLVELLLAILGILSSIFFVDGAKRAKEKHIKFIAAILSLICGLGTLWLIANTGKGPLEYISCLAFPGGHACPQSHAARELAQIVQDDARPNQSSAAAPAVANHQSKTGNKDGSLSSQAVSAVREDPLDADTVRLEQDVVSLRAENAELSQKITALRAEIARAHDEEGANSDAAKHRIDYILSQQQQAKDQLPGVELSLIYTDFIISKNEHSNPKSRRKYYALFSQQQELISIRMKLQEIIGLRL